MTLPDSFLQSLVNRLDGPDVIGISHAGSFARGQAGTHSDVDLQVYVHTLPESKYHLRHWDGYLISVAFNTIEAERSKLSRPETAVWAVPGLRQSVILLDKDGSLAKLKQAALEFEWLPLQSLADEYAVKELMGFAEEAHKILDGLLREHESTVLYATWGLLFGLGRALAVQRGLLMETENRFFDVIQDATSRDSAWTRAFRLALGADATPANHPPFQSRGAAALALYRETASLFKPIIPEKYREVIETTVQLIEEAGY